MLLRKGAAAAWMSVQPCRLTVLVVMHAEEALGHKLLEPLQRELTRLHEGQVVIGFVDWFLQTGRCRRHHRQVSFRAHGMAWALRGHAHRCQLATAPACARKL